MRSTAYVAGTFDTKSEELHFIAECIRATGVPVKTVDLSTSDGGDNQVDVSAKQVAASHEGGVAAVFTGERGSAVSAMAQAFANYVVNCQDLGGIIGAGGSGGTALVAPAMRALPVGVPKVLISTVASGDVRPYVGPSDICMMNSVTDVQGINRISRRVLLNGAHALAGMIANSLAETADDKPALGLTMFGVTTPCIQALSKELEDRYDCLVFHATGVGGQSMEKLVDSGLVSALLDVTTTEIADHLMGGVLSAGEERLDAVIRTGLPYVGSVGALDMVNFGAETTVPEAYKDRQLLVHNPQVTLMRTTPEENAAMGRWIVEKLNRMEGPVRFLLPLKGVSIIDVEGAPFFDPEADQALFEAIRNGFVASENRKLIEVDAAVNDPEFVAALLAAFSEIEQH
ncbi:Tm-1-like ATP-binding domain-containing protein [Pseudovibrio exalbescens]|uniref:Tm-1-like ATP-binding domain-containing protein n=1 Tax=Pseudovibrio exalbescens TaxID=197461 RepID=UPI000C9A1AF7|nr:Tm-1-like ATP-binding domain-containing protein [Pseudovibrio exalbescens]